MKLNILLLLILLSSSDCYCQLNIQTDKKSTYTFDQNRNPVLKSKESITSLLEFNKDFTILKHTIVNSISTVSTTYRIKEFYLHESATNFKCAIISDNGNSYSLLVDFSKNGIIFYSNKNKDEEYGTIWRIKN